jgi:O-antigen ligase
LTNAWAHQRRPIKHPLLIAFLGITLGTAVYLILLLPVKYALVGLLALLAPLIAKLTGRWKDFFISLLVLGIPLQVKKTLFSYSPTHICGPGGIDLTMADGALLVLYVHWLYGILSHKHEKPFHISRIDSWLLLFIVFNGLSLLNASDQTLWAIDYLRVIKVALLYFYLANNIKRINELALVIRVILVGVFVHCGISVVQYALGRPLGFVILGEATSLGSGEFAVTQLARPSGLMQGANTSALYLVLVLPLAFIAQFWKNDKGLKLWGFLTFFLGIFTLIITSSRGGWLGFMFAFPLLVVLCARKGILTYKGHFPSVAFLGLMLLAIIVFFSPQISDRLLHSSPIPVHTRSFLNQLGLRMIGSSPLLGVGLNNFAESAKAHDLIGDIPDPHDIHDYVSENPVVHNLYLLTGAEIGLAGLIVFFLILRALLKASWASIQSEEPAVSRVGCALFCFVIGFLVAEIFDFSYRLDQTYYLFWALAGLVAATRRMNEASDKPS